MTTLREAAAAALEALTVYDGTNGESKRKRVLATLRAALAEPNDDYERGFIDGMKKQAQSSVDKAVNGLALPTCKDHLQVEPVAWRVKVGTTDRFGNRTEMIDYNEMGIGEPLYTAPQPCPTCESLARAVMLDQTGRA